jgi:DNA-binding NarL/FixJ family response regulator
MIRIVLADDHVIVLEGLEQVCQLQRDIEVAARCRNGTEALEAVARLRPDVLVLDLNMRGLDGLDVMRSLQAQGDPTRVLILTATMSTNEVMEAVRLGVHGIILKEMSSDLLVDAIRTVAAGGRWMEKELVGRAVERLAERDTAERDLLQILSSRELEVLRRVSTGARNKDIGEALGITEGTVKAHLHNIYEKLGVGNRVQLHLLVRDKRLV